MRQSTSVVVHDPVPEPSAQIPGSPLRTARYYRPELDALRFFAFVAVFLHHLLPESQGLAPRFFALFPWLVHPVTTLSKAGAIGLPMFFTLSAFLIAELLLSERDKTGDIHIGSFMLRRILRIWPLYFFALGIGLLLAWHHHTRDQFVFIAACAVFLGNWSYLLQPIPWANPFGPLWSISVEEQFYVAFPWIVKASKGRYVAAIGGVIALIALACIAYQGRTAFGYANAWYNSFSQALYFGVGMLIAAQLHDRNYAPSNLARVGMLVAALGTAYICTVFLNVEFPKAHFPAGMLTLQYALGGVVCALLLLGLYKTDWHFPNVIVSLGKISYGLYVFHTFSMFTFAIVLHGTHINDYILRGASIVMTVLLAKLSFKYIETPFLQLKHRFARVQSGPAV